MVVPFTIKQDPEKRRKGRRRVWETGDGRRPPTVLLNTSEEIAMILNINK